MHNQIISFCIKFILIYWNLSEYFWWMEEKTKLFSRCINLIAQRHNITAQQYKQILGKIIDKPNQKKKYVFIEFLLLHYFHIVCFFVFSNSKLLSINLDVAFLYMCMLKPNENRKKILCNIFYYWCRSIFCGEMLEKKDRFLKILFLLLFYIII